LSLAGVDAAGVLSEEPLVLLAEEALSDDVDEPAEPFEGLLLVLLDPEPFRA
jgi:hypothetical protein